MATGVQQGRAWPHCWCSKRSASSWELGAEQVLSRSRKAPSLSSCWQVVCTTSPCGLPLARTQALRPASLRIHSADSHLQGTLAATANQPTAGESAAGSLAHLLLPGSDEGAASGQLQTQVGGSPKGLGWYQTGRLPTVATMVSGVCWLCRVAFAHSSSDVDQAVG